MPNDALFLDSEQSDGEGSIEISSPQPFLVSKQVKKQRLGGEKEGDSRSPTNATTLSISEPNLAGPVVSQPAYNNENEIVDEFAELDAWVQSGAIEIV